VQKAALVETQPATASAAANHKFPLKILLPSFRESFIPSGKQGGGAAVLGEGCVIVTRETCGPASLTVNNLGKAAVLHLCLGLLIIGHNCAYAKFS
jgi:hypothetical protein